MNDPALQSVYDSLWQSAEAAFARGEIRVDAHLRDPEADRRRGLTLILRLDDTVAHAIGAFIDELRQIEPGQYFYTPGQCHVTVLSLRTATSEYVHEPDTIAAYERALGEALLGAPDIAIRFEGVTATPEAVMIRGFPEHGALNHLRTKIFDTMTAHGLPVKQRYAPTTAHVTVMRFAEPGRSLPVLAEFLRSCRSRYFGASRVRRLETVENDWYMSPDRLLPIRAFAL